MQGGGMGMLVNGSSVMIAEAMKAYVPVHSSPFLYFS